jgi:quercetin dioxygenase-like cupin family protein
MVLPNTANQEVAVYEVEYEPGGMNPRHLHPAAIIFHILSGTGVWQEEGRSPVTLRAGDSLFVPAGTIHSHWNPNATERCASWNLSSLTKIKAAQYRNH